MSSDAFMHVRDGSYFCQNLTELSQSKVTEVFHFWCPAPTCARLSPDLTSRETEGFFKHASRRESERWWLIWSSLFLVKFGLVKFGQGWVQILMLVNCLMRDLHLGQLGGGVL